MFLFTPLLLLFVISVLTSGQSKLFLGVLGRTAWQNTRNKKAGESTRKRSVQPSSLLGLCFFLIFLFQDSFPVSRVMLPQGIFFGRNQDCFSITVVSRSPCICLGTLPGIQLPSPARGGGLLHLHREGEEGAHGLLATRLLGGEDQRGLHCLRLPELSPTGAC